MQTTRPSSNNRSNDSKATSATSMVDRAAEYAHGAVDSAVDAATPTAEWLNEQGQELNAMQQKLFTDARRYIQANPLLAVAVGAAAGFLLSRLMRIGGR